VPDRFINTFKILTGRNPVLMSAAGSNLRKLMSVIKSALDETVTSINDSYNANFIQTASGEDLDNHGETLNLKRNPSESDSDYRNRLLSEFRDIPTGLTVASLKNAVDQVMGPGTEVDEYYKSIWDWPEYDPDTSDPGYSWERPFNPIDNRYFVAAIITSEPTENELDQIETNVIAEKPSHIIVRIVELRPGFYELFREIA